MISGLNKDLQQTKEELKSMSESYAANKEEMSNHEQRIEEITVDKELAEAKAEELEDEMEKLKEKFEETKLVLEVLKSEKEKNVKEGAASTFQNKQMEKEGGNTGGSSLFGVLGQQQQPQATTASPFGDFGLNLTGGGNSSLLMGQQNSSLLLGQQQQQQTFLQQQLFSMSNSSYGSGGVIGSDSKNTPFGVKNFFLLKFKI